MRLRVLAPAETVIDQEVDKVVGRSPDGSFCLLPHHVDFISELVPSILAFEDEGGREHSVALDEGILTKCGDEVLIATRGAVPGALSGEQMGSLREIDEEEKNARAATERLAATAPPATAHGPLPAAATAPRATAGVPRTGGEDDG